MNDKTSNPDFGQEDAINKALAEISDLAKPVTDDTKISLDAFYYLLLLWASFHVFPLEPSTDPFPQGPTIIPLDNGLEIYDYGDTLSVSQHYASYCTGKIITAAQEIIKLMAQRGVTKLGFLGHEVARRAGWMECLEHEIKIINYEPSDFDWEVRRRILEAREKAKKTKPGIMKRPELDK